MEETHGTEGRVRDGEEDPRCLAHSARRLAVALNLGSHERRTDPDAVAACTKEWIKLRERIFAGMSTTSVKVRPLMECQELKEKSHANGQTWRENIANTKRRCILGTLMSFVCSKDQNRRMVTL